MANPEHLAILDKGVKAWNQWRKERVGLHANLDDADLRDRNLVGCNLSLTFLKRADLTGADLARANLNQADLIDTKFHYTDVTGANFEKAYLGGNTFSHSYLNGAKGLECCFYRAPCSVDDPTLLMSWPLPKEFLQGCGLNDDYVDWLQGRFSGGDPIQFHSCFISYSSSDEDFAQSLYAKLQEEGVRCWFAPHDLPIGAKIRPGIDEAIRVHEKLLLILSENAIGSDWVEKEVETAFEEERKREGVVLFPIRLDNSVMEIKEAWAADIRRQRNIGDFTDWQDPDSYKKAFERLLRDLKAGTR